MLTEKSSDQELNTIAGAKNELTENEFLCERVKEEVLCGSNKVGVVRLM